MTHIASWAWNRGCIVFPDHPWTFKVKWAQKIHDLFQIWVFPNYFNLNLRMAMKWQIASRSMKGRSYVFSRSYDKVQGHTGHKLKVWIWFEHLRMRTPVSIHRWLWNGTLSPEKHKRGALLFFKVTPPIPSSLVWLQLSNPSDLSCSLTRCIAYVLLLLTLL